LVLLRRLFNLLVYYRDQRSVSLCVFVAYRRTLEQVDLIERHRDSGFGR
jgi:hypothetical protein